MQGTPQQKVAYAATLMRDNAHDWFMAYLCRNQGRSPRDWVTLSATLVEGFGSRLREKQALTNIMSMRQNRRSVQDYAPEFENCIGRLSSYDKATLLQIFIWGLEKDLPEKVSTTHPKTLLFAIGIAEDLELAIRFVHRPPVKGAVASSLGLGIQANSGGQHRSNGMVDAVELGFGGELAAARANGGRIWCKPWRTGTECICNCTN